MLLSLIVGPVFFLVQSNIWKAVFQGKEQVNGLTLDQMLVYFAAATLIYYLIMDFADWNLQMLIRTGKFLSFRLRPMSHWFYALSQKVGHRVLGFIFEFMPVYLMFLFLFRIPLVPQRPFWFVISILLSFLMLFLVNYCIGVTGFWLTQAEGIRRVFQIFRDILAGTFLPLSFFPAVFQKILFFLPFQFIIYVPLRVFMGHYELAGISLDIPIIVGIQALAVFAMAGITALIYKAGIKKFTGVGA